MSVYFVRPALAIIGAVFAWNGVSTVLAADVTPPAPAVIGAAPVTVGAGEVGCASCQSGLSGSVCKHGLLKSKCPTCGKLFTGSLLHKSPNPYPVTLCPGTCFGYFQTQWRKWDEACPYPYLGVGVSDAARTPGMMVPPTGPNTLGPPRGVDPKMPDTKMPDPKKVGSVNIPPIPSAPTVSKFAP
jgi:hypothetical protein